MAKNTGSSSGTGDSSSSGTGDSPSSGTGDSPGSGTGGTKTQFFKALRKNMENKGWKTVSVPGFDWAAIETAHYDLDTLFAAFDADATDILEGAHIKLSHWADRSGQKMPETRIALAVFDSVPRDQVEFITKELQAGTRMGVQSMTGVVDLKTGNTYEPQEGTGAGYQVIRINKPVFEELRAVIKVLAQAIEVHALHRIQSWLVANRIFRLQSNLGVYAARARPSEEVVPC